MRVVQIAPQVSRQQAIELTIDSPFAGVIEAKTGRLMPAGTVFNHQRPA